jgi:hypothetical protein
MADAALEHGEPPTRARGWFLWPALLLIGWLLYELTQRPALAITTICLKFGWEDFRTALWLLRRDTRRGRAWACSWLYLSSGLWKTTVAALLLLTAYVIGLAIAESLRAQRGQQIDLEVELIASSLTGFVGAVLAVLMTCLAVLLALLCRAKLWLNRHVHRARREDRWPPPDEPAARGNRAGVLTLVVLVTIWLGLMVGFIIVMSARPRIRAGNLGALWLILFQVPWWAGLYLLYLGQNYLERVVFARSPSDCWGEAGATPDARCAAADLESP